MKLKQTRTSLKKGGRKYKLTKSKIYKSFSPLTCSLGKHFKRLLSHLSTNESKHQGKIDLCVFFQRNGQMQLVFFKSDCPETSLQL